MDPDALKAELLELLSGGPLPFPELAESVAAPREFVFRLLRELEQHDQVKRDGEKWSLKDVVVPKVEPGSLNCPDCHETKQLTDEFWRRNFLGRGKSEYLSICRKCMSNRQKAGRADAKAARVATEVEPAPIGSLRKTFPELEIKPRETEEVEETFAILPQPGMRANCLDGWVYVEQIVTYSVDGTFQRIGVLQITEHQMDELVHWWMHRKKRG